jgi:hypothetical protein
MRIAAMAAALTMMTMAAGSAQAADGTLYEVSEAVEVTKSGSAFKSSDATLTGWMKAGTPLCPSSMAVQFGISACWVVVKAVGAADDTTGVGPVTGTFYVLSERANSADAPEQRIMKGTITGTLDLSPAFFQKVPLGSIRGAYKVEAEKISVLTGYKAEGAFRGTFRLPFKQGEQAVYLLDNGTVTPANPYEFSVGMPTPRLEVTFDGVKQ